MHRRQFLVGSAATLTCMPPGFAQTHTTLNQAARLIMGFPPGGPLDLIVRLLAERLKNTYAPIVTVENRPGAAGRIVMDALKTAEPDGSHIVFGPASVLVVYPHVYQGLSYDPFRDFSLVSTLCTFRFGLSVGALVPAQVRTVQQFAQWCKENPSMANVGSPGEGTIAHFTALEIARVLGIELQHIPYKGGAPAIQAVAGGQVAASVNVLSDPLPFVPDGRVCVLATTGAARSPFLPEVPTMQESGFADFDVQEYFVALAPTRTPDTIVAALAEQIRAAIFAPQLQETLAARPFLIANFHPQDGGADFL